jgi:hypothetical protein
MAKAPASTHASSTTPSADAQRKAMEAAKERAAARAKKAAADEAKRAADLAKKAKDTAKKQAGGETAYKNGQQVFFKRGEKNRPSTRFEPSKGPPLVLSAAATKSPTKSGQQLTAEQVKTVVDAVNHFEKTATALTPNAKKALDSVAKLINGGDVTTKEGLAQLGALLSTGRAATDLATAVTELTKSVPQAVESVLGRAGLSPSILSTPEGLEKAQKTLESSSELKQFAAWGKDLAKIATVVKGVTGPMEAYKNAVEGYRGYDDNGKQLSLLERGSRLMKVPGGITDALPAARMLAIGAQQLSSVAGLKTAADCAAYFRKSLGKLDKVVGAPLEKLVGPAIEKMAPDVAKKFLAQALQDIGNPQFTRLFANQAPQAIGKGLAEVANRWAGPVGIAFEVAKFEAQVSLAMGAKAYNNISSYLTTQAMGGSPENAIKALRAADVMSPDSQTQFSRLVQSRDFLPGGAGAEWRSHLDQMRKLDPKLDAYLKQVKDVGIKGAATREQYEMASRLREEAVQFIQQFQKNVGKW